MNKLEDIGFYTLSDRRARHASSFSPLMRCEMVLTDRCNFKCPYCRGLAADRRGDLAFSDAENTLRLWISEGLENVRFTGGEPTLYAGLIDLVRMCYAGGVKRIALSTNGSADLDVYKGLISAGVNDFSISLDSGCCSLGDYMAGGIAGSWDEVTSSIRELSRLTYVTAGMVFNEDNVNDCKNALAFAGSLGVADIRVIPSAQYAKALTLLSDIPDEVLARYPVLRYRINNLRKGRGIRGICPEDCGKCHLVLDDMVVAKNQHYPCIVYLREGGKPIGKVGPRMRSERLRWSLGHDCKADPICSKNCLDICIDYNNKVDAIAKGRI